jgi:flavin reductase (DIM6/NTAB) family NADH-FMN oxidoreductase RutF
MGLEARVFRRVVRSLAAGVTVVTTRDLRGRPRGLTATAACLVSWEPPLLLACIERTADCYPAFAEAEAFAVNVLREDQESLSRHFASKSTGKFDAVLWREGDTGAPILDGVLAHVECRVTAHYPAGDHTIFLGEAVGGDAATAGEPGTPLVYFRGAYTRLAAEVSPPRP